MQRKKRKMNSRPSTSSTVSSRPQQNFILKNMQHIKSIENLYHTYHQRMALLDRKGQHHCCIYDTPQSNWKYIAPDPYIIEPVWVHDPNCPPGHVVIPSEERKETLRVLYQFFCMLYDKNKAIKAAMKKCKDHRTQILYYHKQKEYEKNLKVMRTGIKKFSMSKVYLNLCISKSPPATPKSVGKSKPGSPVRRRP